VLGTTADGMREVADQAREQAGTVTVEAREQARKVVSSATSELNAQLEQRLSGAAGTARSTAGELRALAEGRVQDAGRAADLARQAGDRLERFADRVDRLGLRGVTDEVTDFARRRPAAFLFSAAGLGIVVGRLARAGTERPEGSPEPTSTRQTPVATSPALGDRPRQQPGDPVLIDLADAPPISAPSSPLPYSRPTMPPTPGAYGAPGEVG
jgi:vacuolar-type H+-ATPase subunit H